MKKLIWTMAMFATCSTAFAQTFLNGVYCGDGEVTIQGQKYKGSKVLQVATSATELHLERDHIDLGEGSYMEGTPVDANVSDGKIIYGGAVVGTMSPTELNIDTFIDGFKMKYEAKSLSSGGISFDLSSDNGSFRIEEHFPELKPCSF